MNKIVNSNVSYGYVPVELVNSSEISLKAKGLYACLTLNLPEDGHMSISMLASINKDGIASIESGLRELEAAGYLVRTRKNDSRGCFCTLYELKDN